MVDLFEVFDKKTFLPSFTDLESSVGGGVEEFQEGMRRRRRRRTNIVVISHCKLSCTLDVAVAVEVVAVAPRGEGSRSEIFVCG